MAREPSACRQGALESHAAAEADTVFDAAATAIDAGPERARPSSRQAEKDKAPATTSKSPVSIKAAAICVQQLTSSSGMHLRRMYGQRTLDPPHSAFDSVIRWRALAVRRGGEPTPGRHLPSKPCSCYYFPGEVLLTHQLVSDRASTGRVVRIALANSLSRLKP